ncbi:GGDEF domain-containing protein [Acidaminobacter sp. JC074]|uniref:GGDEF domain-containing protein n=1 Tax=Acidaminobacter sp. JC074 TaxID=2530199 RepID=UPI001F0D87BE|nr:GGDEF domain-containing protein [Acidaminobacter sp. JC074]MCH4891422.1 GGDEF domain-containing protein [Acidaminobacter sp. JC074]
MLNTRLYIYFYALSILSFILGYTLWATSKKTKTMWLFIGSVCCNIGVLLFEGASWPLMTFTTKWAVRLHFITNSILYNINLLPMISLFLYFDYRVIKHESIRKRRIILYGSLIAVMSILNISNYWTGILFRISDVNVYSRGPGMYFTVAISLSVLLLYAISMIKYMKSIEGRLLIVMLSFTVMPITGAIIQAFNYGIPAMWTMFTLLSLFIFIFIEREDMLRDTLTGLVTRGQFEQRLKRKLKRSKAFTLVMIDMDRFKLINDTYGHEEGDKVLVTVASILEHSIKHIDMASRYGGDEFMLLLETSEEEAGNLVMKRIESHLSAYNNKNIKPYKIQLSMGHYFIFDPQENHYSDVLAIVDENMYITKKEKR